MFILQFIIINYLYGLINSFLSIFEIFHLIFTKTLFIKYFKLIIFNIIFLILPNYVLDNLNIYFKNYSLLYIIYFIKFIWNITMYICCYVISIDKIGEILGNYFNSSTNFKINNDNFIKNIYFTFLSTVFYISINIVNLVPYIGKILLYFFQCISYGYFCFEYACSYKNIENIEKITIVEQNPFIFLGFGTTYTLLYLYINYIYFLVFFIIIFPLSVIRLSKMNIYKIIEQDSYNSKIFIFPIYILNATLSIIDSNIITLYNLKFQNYYNHIY